MYSRYSSEDDETQFKMSSPQYMLYDDRLSSYKKWPQILKYLIEPLSETGFFYTQKGDEVQCFCCGGALKHWNDGEHPGEQHAIWFPKCHYINMVKGTKYIDFVNEKIVVKV